MSCDSVKEYLQKENGGKIFLLNLILAEVRRMHEIALAVASSGIAATLLDGRPDTGKSSGMAGVLKKCQLSILDECTMAHEKGLEALDQTMRDFRSTHNGWSCNSACW